LINSKEKKIVNELFIKILNRPADKIGISHYCKLLENGQMTYETLEKEIRESPENQVKKIEKLRNSIPTFKTSYNELEIQAMVNSISSSIPGSNSGWYHSFKFENILTKDTKTSMDYQMWTSQGLPLDLSGKSVLDIGAADGFYSFLCEQRGAKRVLAIDQTMFPGFKIAKKILNSKVEHKELSVLPHSWYREKGIYDMDMIQETFDIILLFGVYYHLDNPLLSLQKIFDKVNETLFLAGHIIDDVEPLMYFYDAFELNPADQGNWWVATSSCLLKMGKRIGFKNGKMLDDLKIENYDIPSKIQESKRKLNKVGTFEFSK
jgi:tRNA (mo5U34)-methyltransferase